MQVPHSLILISSIWGLTASSPAVATQVTTIDLEGKRICWSQGDIDAYTADGKFQNNRWGGGRWKVTANGFEIRFDSLDDTFVGDFEKRDDGTFAYTGSAGDAGKVTGRYCE